MNVHSESVKAIAKKDFQDAVRSYLFWGLSFFFFTLMVSMAAGLWYFEGDVFAEATTEGLVSIGFNVTRLILPLIALALGWKAIAGERSSGSIKVLLSLPHSRTDMMIGKLVGRSAVLSLSLVIGFLLAAIFVFGFLGTFDLTDYLGLLVMSVVYGVAYTSLAITVSSLTKSTKFAAAGAFGIFVLFYIMWEAIMMTLVMLVQFEYLPDSDRMIEFILFFNSLDLGTAFSNSLIMATSVAELGEEVEQILEVFYDGSLPFYVQDWWGLVVMALWLVVPFAIAIYRFEQIDL